MTKKYKPRSRAYRTGSQAKARSQNRLGIVVIAGVFLLVGVVAAFWFTTRPLKVDLTTNCPVTGPKTLTAVVIDATDAISAVQKIAIENELKAIRADVPRYAGLAIYSAGVDGEISRPLFFMCNPGAAGDIDPLVEGVRPAVKRWREEFDKPLTAVLETLLKAPPAKRSPLLEAVQSVSVQSFGPVRNSGTGPGVLRLVLVTDLLQHSEVLSLYDKAPPLERFVASEAYRRIRADLRDVDVQVFLIRRQTKNAAQNADLLKFWEGLLAVEGGRLVRMKPLEG